MIVKRMVSRACATISMASLLLLPSLAMSDYRNSYGNTYRITISNLTAGQPLTPPVIATHTRRTGIFRLGELASEEIRAIAENGNNVPLVTALSGDVQVHELIEGTMPIVPANNPGGTQFSDSATFTITTRGRARFVSFISMLICTNDGFTGINTVSLPNRKKTVYSVAYETRTEQNTEDFADIVPPCQGLIGSGSEDGGTGESNPLLAEEGIVIPHVGITGGDDLQPRVHGWTDPVAKITIERVRH